MYDLKEKTVLITGAAIGIGASIATQVLKEGAKHVTILDINEVAGIKFQNELNNTFGGNKAKFVKCDVSNDEHFLKVIQDVKDEQGTLDVMVNNAGVANEKDYAAIRKLIEINYIAVVNGTVKAIEVMDKRKGGRGGTVINCSSIAGLLPIVPPLFAYSSSKSALLQFGSCIGHESFFHNTGVRVISLCFGLTDTTIVNSSLSFGGEHQAEVEDIINVIPIQSTESAAKGTVVAYEKGKSASIWVIANGKAVDISDRMEKKYQEMAKLINP